MVHPAERKKVSHRTTRDILVKKGFAVFVVNGDGLELTLPNKPEQSMLESKTEQLNTQIMRLYRENNLEQFPAITGNVCIGRGISIMSPDFIFDIRIPVFARSLPGISERQDGLRATSKAGITIKHPGSSPLKNSTVWRLNGNRSPGGLRKWPLRSRKRVNPIIPKKTAFKTKAKTTNTSSTILDDQGSIIFWDKSKQYGSRNT